MYQALLILIIKNGGINKMINQYALTKKEQGRINSALNQSRLNLFDTKDNMKSDSINKLACRSMTRCTTDIKKSLDVFLCGTTTSAEFRKLFSTIDSKGVENLSQICSELDNNPNVLNKAVIRTVFGGTENMPFRALVYLLPALNMCEELLENASSNSIPNIEYYFMNGAGIITNAIDPDRVNYATSEFIKIAQKYIEEYHPQLKDKIDFYVDMTFSSNIINTPEYQGMHKILERKLGLETDLKTDLLEMGERRKKSDNSIKYATLHSFVHDGYVNSNIARMTNFFGTNEPREYDTIISIGAKPEEKFYKARKLLAEEIANIPYFTPKKTVQYIANINVPPYSPLPTGELYISDVLKDPELIMEAKKRKGEYSAYQTPVQKAVESLITDIDRSDSNKDIIDFIEECRQVQLYKQI